MAEMKGKERSLKMSILLVEDDQSMSNVINYNLAKEGYKVFVAADGKEGFEMAQCYKPDLIILDWMLPKQSGLDVCMSLRENVGTANIPVVMISSRDDDLDKVTGLERGADDYITKPFAPIELIARIRAILRRIRPAYASKKLRFSDVEMDLSSHSVKRNDTLIKLAPIEFQIFQILLENPNIVLSREELISKVWGPDVAVDARTVDVHMTRLRKALMAASPDGVDIIKTVRLVGYKLDN